MLMSQNPLPKTKKEGRGGNNCKEDGRSNYGQDRDERQNYSYHRYKSDLVGMFDSTRIIKLDASQNRDLARVGTTTREKYRGISREVNSMKVWCRRTRSRGSVSTTTTTTTMITTCAAYWDKYLLQDLKEYVPDLIPMTKVLNLLLR